MNTTEENIILFCRNLETAMNHGSPVKHSLEYVGFHGEGPAGKFYHAAINADARVLFSETMYYDDDSAKEQSEIDCVTRLMFSVFTHGIQSVFQFKLNQ